MALRIMLWLSSVIKVIPKNKGKLHHYIKTAKYKKKTENVNTLL